MRSCQLKESSDFFKTRKFSCMHLKSKACLVWHQKLIQMTPFSPKKEQYISMKMNPKKSTITSWKKKIFSAWLIIRRNKNSFNLNWCNRWHRLNKYRSITIFIKSLSNKLPNKNLKLMLTNSLRAKCRRSKLSTI